MKKLNKQMELFDIGGLKDEGGTTDPVSGNKVPTGSLKKEVRDDIPAQLSEGEFVMPADVVRYHGLDKMMQIRDEAKAGLKRMEDMGQMGNADEAILPDDVPFNENDLELEEEPREFQIGGFNPSPQNQFGIAGYKPSQVDTNMIGLPPAQPIQPPTIGGYTPPQQQMIPITQSPNQLPSFGNFIPSPTGAYDEVKTYINEQGLTLNIPFVNGKPIYPIPTGYKLKPKDEAVGAVIGKPPESAQTASQKQQIQQDDNLNEDVVTVTKKLSPFEKKIERIESMDAFGEVKNLVDKRTTGDKFSDTIGEVFGNTMLGKVLGADSTKNKEYAKTLREISVNVANYTDNPKEQEALLKEIAAELKGPQAGTKRKEEAAKVPVLTELPVEKAIDSVLGQDKVGTATVTDNRLDFPSLEIIAGKFEKPSYDENKKKSSQLLDAIDKVLTFRAGVSFDMGMKNRGKAIEQLNNIINNRYKGLTDDDINAAKKQSNSYIDRKILSKEDIKIIPPAEKKATEIQQENLKNEMTLAEQMESRRRLMGGESRNPIRDAATLRREKQKDPTYNPSTDKDVVYTSPTGTTFNQSGIGVNDSQGNSIQGAGKGQTFASGYLTTDDNGKIVGAAIPGSKEYEERENTKDEPKSIVCTEMYRQTQLDDWYKTMKIWHIYQKKYLTKYHQIGYHYLFKPYVKGMKKSNILTSIGAYLAIKRTQHIKHILTKGKSKDSMIGNIWCKIIHPIVYITGKLK